MSRRDAFDLAVDAGDFQRQADLMKTLKRTPPEKLLGIARASQKLGDIATARAALAELNAKPQAEHLIGEITRVAALVAADYEKERTLGEGALLDLNHFFVMIGISRGRYPDAVLETARKHQSAAARTVA